VQAAAASEAGELLAENKRQRVCAWPDRRRRRRRDLWDSQRGALRPTRRRPGVVA
jgi:hypothetical protein